MVPFWRWHATGRKPPIPDLSGENGRIRLVDVAAEVGGRWNNDGAVHHSVANALAQEVPLVLQGRLLG